MKQKTVTIKPWIKQGNMLVNADCLDANDPDQTYNQIKRQGVNPEDYGYSHPLTEEFKDKTRADLIDEIVNLRQELLSYMRQFG
jgi:hypothetical protein